TPPSSSAGGPTVTLAPAPTTSWRRPSASTSPRSWRPRRPDFLPLAPLAGVYGAQDVSDAHVRPDAQDPPRGRGRGCPHWCLPAGWSWLARASRASRTSAASTATDSRLETVTERAPKTGGGAASRCVVA